MISHDPVPHVGSGVDVGVGVGVLVGVDVGLAVGVDVGVAVGVDVGVAVGVGVAVIIHWTLAVGSGVGSSALAIDATCVERTITMIPATSSFRAFMAMLLLHQEILG